METADNFFNELPCRGFFRGRKLSQILRSIRESFPREIYFQAVRYRASGCGALGYHKFAKVFSAKINFQAIHESFLQRKKPAIRYSMTSVFAREVVYYVMVFHNVT